MRYIRKSKSEPPELLTYRKSAGPEAYWDGFPNKESLRPKLLADQRHICCYCMRRIDADNMKIEHYHCRSRHPEEELSWQNLLAACRGGEGEPIRTCDTSKDDKDIHIDPRKQDHAHRLKYLGTGKIVTSPKRPDFDRDINDVLNLNARPLLEQRKAALDGFTAGLAKRLGKTGTWTKRKLVNELERLGTTQRLPEFAGMLEYRLRKLIHHRNH